MNKYWKIELQRAILQIDNPYPKDDFIVSYSDFLKARDYLGYYKFNPVVFNHLVMITNNEWATEKRISRLSLILKVKQYYRVAQEITRQRKKNLFLFHLKQENNYLKFLKKHLKKVNISAINN